MIQQQTTPSPFRCPWSPSVRYSLKKKKGFSVLSTWCRWPNLKRHYNNSCILKGILSELSLGSESGKEQDQDCQEKSSNINEIPCGFYWAPLRLNDNNNYILWNTNGLLFEIFKGQRKEDFQCHKTILKHNLNHNERIFLLVKFRGHPDKTRQLKMGLTSNWNFANWKVHRNTQSMPRWDRPIATFN